MPIKSLPVGASASLDPGELAQLRRAFAFVSAVDQARAAIDKFGVLEKYKGIFCVPEPIRNERVRTLAWSALVKSRAMIRLIRLIVDDASHKVVRNTAPLFF